MLLGWYAGVGMVTVFDSTSLPAPQPPMQEGRAPSHCTASPCVPRWPPCEPGTCCSSSQSLLTGIILILSPFYSYGSINIVINQFWPLHIVPFLSANFVPRSDIGPLDPTQELLLLCPFQSRCL